MALVVATAPEDVLAILESNLTLSKSESVDIVGLRRLDSPNEKVYLADPAGR